MFRTIIAAAAVLLVVAPVSAQGLLGKAKGALGLQPSAAASDAPAVDPDLLQENIVRTYWNSSTRIIEAQALLAEALGLKEQADTLKIEAANLQSGATEGKSSLERNITIASGANAMIQEQLAGGATLSGEGKAKFAASLLPFAEGLIRARTMPADLKAFGETAASGSMLQRASLARKAGTVMFLAKEAPGYLKNTATTFSQILKFAKANGIAAPKEAGAATRALGDF